MLFSPVPKEGEKSLVYTISNHEQAQGGVTPIDCIVTAAIAGQSFCDRLTSSRLPPPPVFSPLYPSRADFACVCRRFPCLIFARFTADLFHTIRHRSTTTEA